MPEEPEFEVVHVGKVEVHPVVTRVNGGDPRSDKCTYLRIIPPLPAGTLLATFLKFRAVPTQPRATPLPIEGSLVPVMRSEFSSLTYNSAW